MENRFKDEVWKDICFKRNGITYDYSGMYQVSNYGRVKSFRKCINGYIMSQAEDKDGYLRVYLNKTNHLVHRLVMIAFKSCDEKWNDMQVNHKDENKKNNNIANLEWCDCKYNINYGSRNEKVRKSLTGVKHGEDRIEANRIGQLKRFKEQDPTRCKEVECDGTVFKSVKECSEYLNIPRRLLNSYLLRDINMPIEYMERNLRFVGDCLDFKVAKRKFKTKVECDGILFESITKCAEYYGVNRRKMTGWINGEYEMPEKYILMGLKKIKIEKEVSSSIY